MKTSKLSMLAFIFFCIFVLSAAGAAGGVKAVVNSATQGCSDHLVDPQSSIITYEDVAPAGYVLEDNYGGLGVDHNGWVYHCIDGYYSAVGIEDTAVFRYNSNTDVKQFLGTLREISEAEGNLEPSEEIAKVHAPVLEYNGKMYFASHSLHDPLEIHRGGHFYSYDLTTGVWTDLSKYDSGGISAPGQGILTMGILRSHNKLVGFAYPKGEIITYDLATQKATNHGRPITYDPWNIGRHIIATDSGKVYFSYAEYDTPLYEFDINTGNFTNTGFNVHYGWLAGNTTNKTRTTVYLLDWLGHIYSINVSSGAIAEIGNIKPAEHADYSVSYLHGLALSHDETRLYTIPEIRDTNDNILGTLLYEYEVETGQKKYHINLLELAGIKRYAIGPAMADDGSIFYHNHNYSTDEVKLVKVYSNCTPTVCSDGTPVNQCSTVTGPPWYCDNSGNLVENCAQCGCPNGLVCLNPPETSCEDPDGDSSLVLHHTFDSSDIIGSTAIDSSGNNNNGVINGAQTTDGYIGEALLFNGTNDYIEIADDQSLHITDMTLSAWVYIGGSIPSGWRTILEHARNTSNCYGLWKSSSSDMFHYRWGSGTMNFDAAISPDNWYHTAATLDINSGIVKTYLNGSLTNEETTTSFPSPASGLLFIGKTGSGEYFSGKIDDVRIYNRALSDTEILDLYTGAPVPDIKANGVDGPVVVAGGEQVTVTIALDPGNFDGDPSDWWVAAYTPWKAWYWYTALDKEWTKSSDPIRAYDGQLHELDSYQVLDIDTLSAGKYTFYFAVDDMDGELDATYLDSVEVTLE